MADETTKVEKPKATKKPAVTNDEILAAVKGTTDAVMALVEVMKSKTVVSYNADARDASHLETATVQAAPTPTGPVAKSTFPVPIEWKDIVENTLNKEFGIEIAPEGDTASFGFSILVPQKYSNAGKPHWETYHEDRRTRIIPHALGLNGVREWVTKIYENFDPETKSRITFDRAQL